MLSWKMDERNDGLHQRRLVYRPYFTRKFFRAYGREHDGIPGLSEGVLEALMGHRNYLRGHLFTI